MHAGKHFGAVRKDVSKKSYKTGELVEVEFQSACPRNSLRTGGTFLTVERWSESSGNWEVVSFEHLESTQSFWYSLVLPGDADVGGKCI